MGELSELREDIFGVEVKKHILWEVVKWQLACRRQGTHSTKTRGEVAYSGRKILTQKGTGNARHGDRRAPIFVSGGVAHGP
jgi:LSU ribosomal protein L4P